MKTKKLISLVQKNINNKVASHSKHFSSETMNRQIRALIEVIAPMLNSSEEKGED